MEQSYILNTFGNLWQYYTSRELIEYLKSHINNMGINTLIEMDISMGTGGFKLLKYKNKEN